MSINLTGTPFRITESVSVVQFPANEVWGKVIFLHLSVLLFTGGGLASKHESQVTGLQPGGSASRGLAHPPGTRKAGGTHPTGMLSCLTHVLYVKQQI